MLKTVSETRKRPTRPIHSSIARRSLLGLLLLVTFMTLVGAFWMEEPFIPQNPLRGRLVFEQKGCVNCHAIQGRGGDIGPDLGQKKFYGSFLQLAGIMWNHAPEMSRRMRELNLPYPEFSRSEIKELVAYLYYLRYLDEPGDLYRGRILVQEKSCLVCHSVGGKGGDLAPAFDELAQYVAPLYLAQSLWNHGPAMDDELKARGLTRPTFEEGEIVDLSAYIRSASRGKTANPIYMSPGNPQAGPSVLREKHCLSCHSLKGEGGDAAPDFAELNWDFSVTEIAGLMWNHGGEMSQLMAEKKIEWPRFEGSEMADLISYLYFLGFEGPPGDPDTGARLFETKGCALCHGPDARGGELGPDLSKTRGLSSTTDMARILWNHAPVMEEEVTKSAVNWPRFEGEEMADLYAYLKQATRHKKD